MILLDLQGMKAPGGKHGGGGSTLTVLTCGSQSPSALSLVLCH